MEVPPGRVVCVWIGCLLDLRNAEAVYLRDGDFGSKCTQQRKIVTSGQGGNTAAPNDVTEEQLNSEVAVLNSNDLLDEVVDRDWRSRPQTSISHAELVAHQNAIRGLRSRLDVSPIRSSHAISVKMVATTPEAG